jgi:hypothetical protein
VKHRTLVALQSARIKDAAKATGSHA